VISLISCHLHFLTSEHFGCSVETLGFRMTDILYISYQSLILVDSRHEFYCTFEQKKMIFFLCCYNSVQCQPSITEVSEQLSQFSVICHGKPRNLDDFAMVSRGISPAAPEFGKISRWKLWALLIWVLFCVGYLWT